jgi:hypothetical protein
MSVKAHSEWTMEELWRQEQGNFSAHMAIMFHYLEKHGLPLDDFIRFVGESVLPTWRRRGESVPDVMNGILLNVRANGATVQDVRITDTHAEATVSSLLRPDVMERYGIAPDVAGRFWNKFVPIASAFGLRFTRTRTEGGQEHIRLEKP